MHSFTDVADDRGEILHFADQIVTARFAAVVALTPSPAVHRVGRVVGGQQ
jgi:hypothetical protein